MNLRSMRCGVAVGLVVAATVLVSGNASAQTKIKPGFNLYSTDQDIEIGRQSALEVERQLPILTNTAVNASVNAVGSRLAASIPGAKFPYQFKVVDVSDINAFALPGGYMYLNRGLIEAAKNEGQLAGVMAHEMSHVALRHGTNQASKAYMGQTGLGLLGGLLSNDSGSTDKTIAAVGGFGLNALFLKFSRADEEQADIVGAQTMAKAGYNPQDMVDFFEMLRAQQTRDPSKVEQFFSSHPAPEDRANRIRNEMTQLTIHPTAQRANVKQAKAILASMPEARSMTQIAQNQPASTAPAATRTYPSTPAGVAGIDAPSGTFQSFAPANAFFRIEYPSNWQAYRAADGLGVTMAPEGGFVDGGASERDLIYGVIVNHYAPFWNDGENTKTPNGRFSFLGAPGEAKATTIGTRNLAAATNDLVDQIFRTNPALRLVPDSQHTDTVDGGNALSLVLTGRSAVTGAEERVTVFTRDLPDHHVIYALFIAPGENYAQLSQTFNRMIASLRVNDASTHE